MASLATLILLYNRNSQYTEYTFYKLHVFMKYSIIHIVLLGDPIILFDVLHHIQGVSEKINL